MDFSKFSDKDFDAKEWVNGALRSHKDARISIDAHASTLVMKLQLFIQEVNKSLEETSLQVVQNLPRVMRDVEAVRQEATLLKEQMTTVKEDIKKVERETAQSMQRLVELDSMKTRMLESQNALQEADNWTTLSADVDDVFASQDIHKIGEKLAGMQQSLNVLHDVPDYEQRKKLLESLKNKLEALLSPRLVAALSSHNLEEAQEYGKMFSSIERYSQLRNYFIGCHKTALVEIWTSLHDPAKSLMSYLPSFYDELLSRWHSEYTWCSQVFSDPLDLLSQLFCGALESLESQISRCLQASLQSSSLSTLTDARQQALKFVKGLEKMISEVPMPSPPLPSLFSLVEAVHAPFCQLLVRYPNLEQQSLTHTLKDMQLYTAAPEDTVSSLSSSIPKVLHSAAQALERCVQLTEGWGTAGLVRALEAFFTQYLSKLSSTVNSLRGSCGLGTRAGGGGASRGEDWAYLQVAFALIQCCGELLLRSEGLNMQVSDCLLSRAASLTSPADQSNPFGLYDYLLVYHPEEHTATMELLTAVEKGGSGGHQLLVTTNKLIHSLNAQAHTFAFDLLFLKLKQKLSNFPKLKVWETGVVSPLESPRALTDDLPSFTLSPLPYITEIGDYLLTLPQQLEPFTSQESPALSAALKQSHLPFPPTDGVAADEREGEEHPSDAWLGAVARGTMSTYMTNILQIPSLSQLAATQLATDISYLCNVLAALGQSPIKQLTQLESLIKATRDEFIGFEKYETIPRQLYQAMAGIRTWHE